MQTSRHFTRLQIQAPGVITLSFLKFHPTNTNGFSALDNLRLLLFEGGDIRNKGIHGGQDLQLLRNTEKVWEWASSARDSWRKTTDVDFIRRQALRILDYLDGRYFITKDFPLGTSLDRILL